jgi:hypothetical protein
VCLSKKVTAAERKIFENILDPLASSRTPDQKHLTANALRKARAGFLPGRAQDERFGLS